MGITDLGGNKTRSFIGKLTDFNVWDGVLSLTAIEDFSNCKDMSQHNSTTKITLDWSTTNVSVTSENVKIFTVSTDELCEEKLVGFNKLFHVPTPYKEALATCKNFNGEMILPTNEIKLNSTMFINHPLLKKYCTGSFWLPIIRSKDNFTEWENDNNLTERVPFIPWMYGQPNGYPIQNCVGEKMLDTNRPPC